MAIFSIVTYVLFVRLPDFIDNVKQKVKKHEYKVSGTLREPKSEPVYYVPKLLLLPLHPLRTLKELLPTDSSRTNTPPPAKTP